MGERPPPTGPAKFYGAVDLDLVRPVKAFESILNAVIMELQRTPGVKIEVTIDIRAEAADGFSEEDVGVVRDNTKNLRFSADSTGFES